MSDESDTFLPLAQYVELNPLTSGGYNVQINAFSSIDDGPINKLLANM